MVQSHIHTQPTDNLKPASGRLKSLKVPYIVLGVVALGAIIFGGLLTYGKPQAVATKPYATMVVGKSVLIQGNFRIFTISVERDRDRFAPDASPIDCLVTETAFQTVQVQQAVTAYEAANGKCVYVN